MLQRATSQQERNTVLEQLGLKHARNVYWNLTPPALYEEAVRRGEGLVALDGPLTVTTGKHTGRSANDKFIVRDDRSESRVNWGNVNKPMAPEQFKRLHARGLA